MCGSHLRKHIEHHAGIISVQSSHRIMGDVARSGHLERSSLALTGCYDKRNSACFVDFLNRVVETWTGKKLIVILDNLSIHKTLDVLLWALAHPHVRFLFQPTYSPWLNLIEPWWKTLKSLALKGRCFQNTGEIIHAIHSATKRWNMQKKPYLWRKVFV